MSDWCVFKFSVYGRDVEGGVGNSKRNDCEKNTLFNYTCDTNIRTATLPAKLATATKFMHILFSDRIHKLTSFSGVCCLVRFKVNDRTGGGVFLYESIGCMQSE